MITDTDIKRKTSQSGNAVVAGVGSISVWHCIDIYHQMSLNLLLAYCAATGKSSQWGVCLGVFRSFEKLKSISIKLCCVSLQ